MPTSGVVSYTRSPVQHDHRLDAEVKRGGGDPHRPWSHGEDVGGHGRQGDR